MKVASTSVSEVLVVPKVSLHTLGDGHIDIVVVESQLLIKLPCQPSNNSPCLGAMACGLRGAGGESLYMFLIIRSDCLGQKMSEPTLRQM